MHYCFFTTGSWEGNASFVRIREFGREMIARGHRVTYLLDDVPYNRSMPDLDPAANLALVPDAHQLSQFSSRRELLKELQPDFVHVLNPSVKSYLTLAPTNHTIIGDWDEWPAERPYSPARKFREKFLDRWLRKRARLVVVASRYLEQQFNERFDLDCVYIPYATYLQHRPDGESPFPKPTAVYMGNLYPAYDHDLLFEAARLLKSRGKTPAVEILGGGPDLEKWREFVTEHGMENVAVRGFITGDELWQHLRHAHVLLFPIRTNVLNLARCPSKTFAYAQARRPIIANHVGEIPQVLGEKAQYIDESAEAFAVAIEHAAESLPLVDVDYGIESQTWAARTSALIDALGRVSS